MVIVCTFVDQMYNHLHVAAALLSGLAGVGERWACAARQRKLRGNCHITAAYLTRHHSLDEVRNNRGVMIRCAGRRAQTGSHPGDTTTLTTDVLLLGRGFVMVRGLGNCKLDFLLQQGRRTGFQSQIQRCHSHLGAVACQSCNKYYYVKRLGTSSKYCTPNRESPIF